MIPSLVWWQFSDVHWPSSPEPERIAFAGALVESLHQLLEEGAIVPSFLAFTGDLARSGHPGDYESLERHLIEPLKALFTPVPVPLLVVPGNHDMARTIAANLNANRITSLSTPSEVDGFLADPGAIDLYARPFRDYAAFADRHMSVRMLNSLTWVYDKAYGDYSIQVVGTNSAWSSHYREMTDDVGDERHLLIGSEQVPRRESTNPRHYRFLMMHHPIDWLNRETCGRAEQRVRGEYDLLLFGHVHSARDLQLVQTPSSTCVFVPSPLLYERPYDESLAFPRGMVIGGVDMETGGVEIRYLRYTDLLGPPRLLPYADVYATGEECFAVRLRRGEHATLRASTGRVLPPFDSEFFEAECLERAHAHFRSTLPRAMQSVEYTGHSVGVLRDLVRALVASGAFTTLGATTGATAAYLLAELTLVNQAGNSSAQTLATIDIPSLANALEPNASGGSRDLASLEQLVSTVDDPDSGALAQHPSLAGCPLSLHYLLFWSLAQYALLLDQPHRVAARDTRVSLFSERNADNVLGVTYDAAKGLVVIRLGTKTRAEFHQVADARHVLEQNLNEVEDLWRRSGMIPPSIRVQLDYPLWRRRSVESHYLEVDPQPVTRLLMGKALYGTRQHVWIRELIQNAIDATEMRRLVLCEPGYVPSVTLRLANESTVVVTDNGIGMNYQQIVGYLGTLGRSGWRSHELRGNGADEPSVYGRFGIGFASVFSEAAVVEVATRTANSRAVEGLSVQFTLPDHPYFVEPVVTDEGTTVTVHLNERIDRSSFGRSLRDLFVYLRSGVSTVPETAIARSLEAVSVLDGWPMKLPVEHRVSRTESVAVGQYRARLHVELLMMDEVATLRMRSRTEFPIRQLTVAVGGMRVFDQPDLTLRRTGQSSGEERWKVQAEAVQFWRCYVTFDFDQRDAPVMPARDAILADDTVITAGRVAIETAVAELLPELVAVATANSKKASEQRRAVLAALNACIDPSHRWSEGSWGAISRAYSASDVVTRAAAKIYAKECPVAVHSAGDGRSLRSLDEIARSGVDAIVSQDVADGRTFPAFARLKEFSQWVVVDDRSEAALLDECWRIEGGLPPVLMEMEDLFGDPAALLPEVRDARLVAILRGDYALARSAMFGSALFVILPSNSRRTPRHRGGGHTRDAVTEPPRVVLNADHPIMAAMERFLAECTREQSSRLRLWLASFCDGVVEDKTKLAPEARWQQLRRELSSMLNVDFNSIPMAALMVTI
jgi:Calcineurin-like phosphoesterase/Histidine kinase-, DNA gyrase B-, and HSP90-like ATPase